MVTRAFAAAIFASNWIAWAGITALEEATSYGVSRASLCAVTVTLGVAALAALGQPRWPWLIAVPAAAVQVLEAALPTSEVEGDWGYFPEIIAMACAATVYGAAVSAFLTTLGPRTQRALFGPRTGKY